LDLFIKAYPILIQLIIIFKIALKSFYLNSLDQL